MVIDEEKTEKKADPPTASLEEEARVLPPTVQPSFKLNAPMTTAFAFLVPLVQEDTETREEMMQRTEQDNVGKDSYTVVISFS
eukprot:4960198-Prymnesium_polylepis.1